MGSTVWVCPLRFINVSVHFTILTPWPVQALLQKTLYSNAVLIQTVGITTAHWALGHTRYTPHSLSTQHRVATQYSKYTISIVRVCMRPTEHLGRLCEAAHA